MSSMNSPLVKGKGEARARTAGSTSAAAESSHVGCGCDGCYCGGGIDTSANFVAPGTAPYTCTPLLSQI